VTTAVPIPPLYEAVLDDRALGALVDDLLAVATLLGVSTKGAGARLAAGETDGRPREQLVRAIGALRERAIAGVQVRYRHEGREWWDTLLRVEAGVRLVRICHDDTRGAS